MKSVILTEGSTEKGFGHITRCIALNDALKSNNFDTALVIDSDDSVDGVLTSEKWKKLNWIKDDNSRNEILADVDCVIIDSYHASEKIYQKIKNNTKILISIDDYNRIDYPIGSIILKIEWQPSTSGPFLITKGINLPTKWHEVILRKEFIDIDKFEITKEISTVMLAFGATDIKSLTPIILEYIISKYPQWNINVIVGPGFRSDNIKKIKALSNNQHNIKLLNNASAKQMKDTMSQSDIAISAAGQTLNELARIGLPTIAITVAENQIIHVQNWERNGFLDHIDGIKNQQHKLINNLEKSIFKIQTPTIRRKMSESGQKILDGKGADRIAKQIIKELKNE